MYTHQWEWTRNGDSMAWLVPRIFCETQWQAWCALSGLVWVLVFHKSKNKVIVVFPLDLHSWMKWPVEDSLCTIFLTKYLVGKKSNTATWTVALTQELLVGFLFSSPITEICNKKLKLNPQQSVTANCLLKHKAMDSENILNFFFKLFLVRMLWGMEGVGQMEKAQKKW